MYGVGCGMRAGKCEGVVDRKHLPTCHTFPSYATMLRWRQARLVRAPTSSARGRNVQEYSTTIVSST